MKARLSGVLGITGGAALFAYSEDVWRVVAGRGCSVGEQVVTQVLGLRHFVQGLAELVAPGPVRRPAFPLGAMFRTTS